MSLKYLFDVDVIQPTDDAFIEAWYPEDYGGPTRTAVALSRPLEKLAAWDGRSPALERCGKRRGQRFECSSSEENRNLASPFDFYRFIEARHAVLEIGCSDGGHVPGTCCRVSDRTISRHRYRCGLHRGRREDTVQGDIAFLQTNLLDEDVLQGRYEAIFAHDVFVILDFPAKEKMLRSCIDTGCRRRNRAQRVQHRVLIGNAMANLLRGNLQRTFYFLALLRGLGQSQVDGARNADR
jgi:hypothetical protein